MKLGFSFSSTGSFSHIWPLSSEKSPSSKMCFFFCQTFRSMETSGCSIYRELLRLHFSDEETFCEDGILAEVFALFINPDISLIWNLVGFIWSDSTLSLRNPSFWPNCLCPGAKDKCSWGWSRLWVSYYRMAPSQVGRSWGNLKTSEN